MERLQKAIDKAREQRDGQIGKVNDETRSTSAVQTPPAKSRSTPVNTQPLPSQIKYTNTPVASIDEKTLQQQRVVAGFFDDSRAEAYRQLRSQVLDKLNQNNWNTLAITSPNEQAGKTHTAVNLAISIAKEVNQTVMLVDLDIRKPNVHERFGVTVEKGIVDCLEDGEPVANIMFNPGIPRLVVVPGRALGYHSSELLSSPEMAAFLADIRSRYQSRIIIFDLPPLLRNDDALVFTPNADACLLVIEDGATSREDISRSMQLLGRSNLIGTVLNKARG